MRPVAGLVFAALLLVVGCHHDNASSSAGQATTIIQVADNLVKVTPEQDPKNRVAYDLRQTGDQESLKEALKPYAAAFAQADAISNLSDPAQPFMSLADIKNLKDTTSGKRLGALKRLTTALCDRAQLEYAQGDDAKGLKDITTACHLCRQLSVKPGAMLPLLVEFACATVALNAIEIIATEDLLDEKDLRQLASVDKGFDLTFDYRPVLEMEVEASAKSTNSADRGAFNDYKKIKAFMDGHAGELTTTFRWLEKTYGEVKGPLDAQSILKMGTGRQIELQLALALHQQSQARITLNFLEALAQKSEKGKFPTTLPIAAKNPFGEGSLSYEASPTGFTISAPHAPEFLESRTLRGTSLSYPDPSPGKTML